MPDVTGMTYAEAVTALESYGLKYEVRPGIKEEEIEEELDFVVLDQYPKAGKRINIEEPVFLYRE